ncbi:hypothetical protein [Brevundimonas nasdae]|uniref:Uncharacterized protein n=1 Tax=Brevundimonas nasdae TaxID=172043 RepID=A0ACD4VL24_9CAUL|nr:hypothetical protein [Brevundimonas nasdae]WOB78521.1 hypothetical protein PZA08_14645 [Brevundimonas nasdae]
MGDAFTAELKRIENSSTGARFRLAYQSKRKQLADMDMAKTDLPTPMPRAHTAVSKCSPTLQVAL